MHATGGVADPERRPAHDDRVGTQVAIHVVDRGAARPGVVGERKLVGRDTVLASPERDDVGRTHLLVPEDAPTRVQRGVTTAGAIGLPDDEVSRVHAQLRPRSTFFAQ
jgi:hypothetical protein